MQKLYSWFLDFTGQPPSEALEWISNHVNRETAFDKGGEFATEMYRLIHEVATDTGTMRYLVV